jgi:hypothetical protein
MRARQKILLCASLATFFYSFPVLGEKVVTGLWIIEIISHSTTTKTQMIVISEENGHYEIKPDGEEWEVAPIENFEKKDDAITFSMGGVVSCGLMPEEDVWSGKCAQDQQNNPAETFSVILRLPEKPASTSTSNE